MTHLADDHLATGLVLGGLLAVALLIGAAIVLLRNKP